MKSSANGSTWGQEQRCWGMARELLTDAGETSCVIFSPLPNSRNALPLSYRGIVNDFSFSIVKL